MQRTAGALLTIILIASLSAGIFVLAFRGSTTPTQSASSSGGSLPSRPPAPHPNREDLPAAPRASTSSQQSGSVGEISEGVLALRRRLKRFALKDCAPEPAELREHRRLLLSAGLGELLQALDGLAAEELKRVPLHLGVVSGVFSTYAQLANYGLIAEPPQTMLDLIDHEHPFVRAIGASSLGAFASRAAEKALVRALDVPELAPRALRSLVTSWSGDSAVHLKVVTLLRDSPDNRVRVAAAETLGHWRSRDAVPDLQSILRSTPPRKDERGQTIGGPETELFAACYSALERCTAVREPPGAFLDRQLKWCRWDALDSTWERVYLRRMGASSDEIRRAYGEAASQLTAEQRKTFVYAIHMFGGGLAQEERRFLIDAGILVK